MLNVEEHLLACVTEECGEVSQVVGKSLRFGARDCKTGTSVGNADLMEREFHDIVQTYKMYREELGLPFEVKQDLLDSKEKRVYKHMLMAFLNNKLDISDSAVYTTVFKNLSDDVLPPYLRDKFSDAVFDGDVGVANLIWFLEECEQDDKVHAWVIDSLEKLIEELDV